MIYTVTFNPSLDYIVTVPEFELGKTNRTDSELLLPGGKGINVSIVLSGLGVQNTAFYFSAGFVGDEITRLVEESGISAETIPIEEGCSRINVKLGSVEGTEINGAGPVIAERHVSRLMKKLDRLMEGDTLVLAGSIPASMPKTIYSDILEHLAGRGIRFVVDATGELLLNVLHFRPFLVKPNNHELGELFGVTLTTRESVVPYAKRLQELGAENVLVSMAGEGAVLVAADGTVSEHDAPKGTLVNAVGAGDSMVAGFLAGWQEAEAREMAAGNEVGDGAETAAKSRPGANSGAQSGALSVSEYAFRMGLAAGSASAFSKYLATGEAVRKVFLSISDQ